jgi:hypothetical protein
MGKRPDLAIRNKQRQWTPEMRERARQAKLTNPVRYWLGKKRPDIAEALRNANRGKVLSEETKRRISDALKGHDVPLAIRKKIAESQKGDKSHAWRGGVSQENRRIRRSIQFRQWREAVFKRDNWTCQKCKKRGGALHPHHIRSFARYPAYRFRVSNGKTLCASCHRKTKSWGRQKQIKTFT